jgi:ABC-type antimicrobial peptide transport system permease subunit
LASIGIFGVLYHSVLQRRQEIGIRSALGASPPRLLRRVVGHGVSLTLGGIAFGLIATYALSPLLAPLLYHTNPHDPVLMLAVSTAFLVVGLCACAGPAFRAARVSPNSVLRSD